MVKRLTIKSKRIISNLKDSTLKFLSSIIHSSKKIKRMIRSKNPDPTKFRIDNFFIYESRLCHYYIQKLNNANKIKPSKNKISKIKNYIDNVSKIFI